MKTTINISVAVLIEILKTINKGFFVHVVMETPVKLRKGNPFNNKVTKITSGNYYTGFVYADRVRKQAEKEGISADAFEAEEMTGRHHISRALLQSNSNPNQHYLMLERFKEIKTKAVYMFEGKVIDKAQVEPYLYDYSESSKQPNKKKINVITPKLENIKSLSINKEKYC